MLDVSAGLQYNGFDRGVPARFSASVTTREKQYAARKQHFNALFRSMIPGCAFALTFPTDPSSFHGNLEFEKCVGLAAGMASGLEGTGSPTTLPRFPRALGLGFGLINHSEGYPTCNSNYLPSEVTPLN